MAGHTFHLSVKAPYPPHSVETAVLGASTSAKFTDADRNKLVKLAAADNYVLVTDGDDIEAMCVSLEPGTVNDGWSYGSVQFKFTNLEAVVSGSTLTVGATVVAGPQEALGTKQDWPVIKAGTGSVFKWRVKSLLGGSGAAGTRVLVEPLTR